MIHINSGMKYTTCSVSQPLIQIRYLSTFSGRVAGPQKQNKQARAELSQAQNSWGWVMLNKASALALDWGIANRPVLW